MPQLIPASFSVAQSGDNTLGRVKITDGTTVALVTIEGLLRVSAAINGSVYYDGTTVLTPAFAFANIAASTTDGNIVTATAAKVIRVLQVAVVAGSSDTSITFNTKPGGAGTAISPLFANAANGGEILPFSLIGWFETNSGDGLTVTTTAGATTGILVAYVKR